MINFKKERDLGAVISDTFKFLRLEWRGLLSVILSTALIPVISIFVLSIFNGIELMDNISNANAFFQFSFLTFVVYFLFILVYNLIGLSVLSYIKVYINNSGTVEVSKVYPIIKSNLINYFILGIITTFLIIIGSVFCLVPGIYLGVVFSVTGSMLVFEQKGIFDAIGDSFSFVNWKWWETFGTLFVMFLILYISMVVFSIPSVIYSFIKMGTLMAEQDMESFNSIMKDPIYIVLAFISNLGQHLLYAISAISVALIYFDINEQKNATGSLEMIDSIGKD